WLYELLASAWFVAWVKREQLKVFVMGTKFWHDWRDTLPHNNLLVDVIVRALTFGNTFREEDLGSADVVVTDVIKVVQREGVERTSSRSRSANLFTTNGEQAEAASKAQAQ
ncbi:unnamed protein product, partial [Amoebophrya sp. A25]